jgi:hypothetical protein
LPNTLDFGAPCAEACSSSMVLPFHPSWRDGDMTMMRPVLRGAAASDAEVASAFGVSDGWL